MLMALLLLSGADAAYPFDEVGAPVELIFAQGPCNNYEDISYGMIAKCFQITASLWVTGTKTGSTFNYRVYSDATCSTLVSESTQTLATRGCASGATTYYSKSYSSFSVLAAYTDDTCESLSSVRVYPEGRCDYELNGNTVEQRKFTLHADHAEAEQWNTASADFDQNAACSGDVAVRNLYEIGVKVTTNQGLPCYHWVRISSDDEDVGFWTDTNIIAVAVGGGGGLLCMCAIAFAFYFMGMGPKNDGSASADRINRVHDEEQIAGKTVELRTPAPAP